MLISNADKSDREKEAECGSGIVDEAFLDRDGRHYYLYGSLFVTTGVFVSIYMLVSDSRAYRI